MKKKYLAAFLVPLAIFVFWSRRTTPWTPPPATKHSKPQSSVVIKNVDANAQGQRHQIDELALNIRNLKHLHFWQSRSWTNRLAIENAFIEIKRRGYSSPDDLPSDLIDNPMDFLPKDRQMQILPLVGDIQKQIRDLKYRLLGEIYESSDVDTLKDLQNREYDVLSTNLTKEELSEWAARNTFEGDQLRELPVALTKMQFVTIANANYEFERQTSELDITQDENLDLLTSLKQTRDKIRQDALGSQEAADLLERAEMPGYAAQVEFSNSLGLDPKIAAKVGDYLWQLNRWMEQVEVNVQNRSPEEQQTILQEAKRIGRAKAETVIGTNAAARWLQFEGLPYQDAPLELQANSIDKPPSEGL